MAEITVRAEAGHGEFTALCRAAGLDITDDWTERYHPVFSAAARRDGKLLAAATVTRRYDRLVLEYVAVEPEARGRGLGKELTGRCLAYAAQAGEKSLWIAAREPAFYQKLGAEETEDTALLADCRRCADYRVSCEPKELVFHLKENP